MIGRRRFILAAAGGLIATPVARTQNLKRVHWLGLLTPAVRSDDGTSVEELIPRALVEFGYAEGTSLKIERRYAEGKIGRLPELAQELVQLGVDVIVAVSPSAVQAAKDATKTIPIVMGFSNNPVEFGFVQSLARPGGNITGVAYTHADLATKRLEYIRQVVPKAARIAIMAAAEPNSKPQIEQAEKTAKYLGVDLTVVTVRDDDYEGAFAAIAAREAGAIFVVSSAVLNRARRRIIALAQRYRLPAIYEWREHVEEGGLMAYGTSIVGLSRRAAAFVDKIFKGANPAVLPVEQPTVFELAINLKTAKALGVTIPDTLMLRADTVIE
jgi:putative tryptophan/tyrosine transport system substrate-binding protein